MANNLMAENGRRMTELLEKFGNRNVCVRNGSSWDLKIYLERYEDRIIVEIGTFSEHECDLLEDPSFTVRLNVDKSGNITEAIPTLYRRITLYEDPIELTRKEVGEELDQRLNSFLDGIKLSGYLSSTDIEEL
ncbi:MAG TPA: hypothetical protein DDX72_05340 [Ruminococcaceae bacterium]|nr:hypothetical protein [Oscillospiraceae bacterium]